MCPIEHAVNVLKHEGQSTAFSYIAAHMMPILSRAKPPEPYHGAARAGPRTHRPFNE